MTSRRRLILKVIEQHGYAGLAAADAGQALEMLDQHDVDLVLLDLHMPGPTDGEDLLFLLRDRGDEVPIIIVSGWVDEATTSNQPDCVHTRRTQEAGTCRGVDRHRAPGSGPVLTYLLRRSMRASAGRYWVSTTRSQLIAEAAAYPASSKLARPTSSVGNAVPSASPTS